MSPLGSMPLRMLPSTGLGRSSTILSISIREPMVDTAEPHSTGQTLPSRTPIFRPLAISWADSSMVSKNFSISSSSAPAAASISSARRASTSSAMSAGMAQAAALPPLTS